MAKLINIIGLLIVLNISNGHYLSDCGCERSLLPELSFNLGGNNLKWTCDSTKNIYVQSGRYIPRNIIITRAQIQKDEAYVALPRYKRGVPFTLGKVNLKKGECLTPIAPFPCWAIQEEGNCQALQSVVDLALDPYGILWVLDVGLVNTLEQPIRRCPPKVLAINTLTGKVVKNVNLTPLITAESRLQYILVDYDEAGRPYLYIADAGARSILVHDVTLQKSYRVLLPTAVTANCKHTDVLYITLVRKTSGVTWVYFTYLGSNRLFAVKAENLRRGLGSGAVVDVGPKPYGKQIVILGSDNGPSVFLRFKGENDIYLWNSETCFKASNLIEVQNGGECRLSTQVLPGHKSFMWALESNFQDFIMNTCGCNGPSVVLHPVVRECDE